MQTTFIPEMTAVELGAIVNVASVRHLSPFRYPGGKTWLVPRVLRWLRERKSSCEILVDPFVGGGSVPLAALCEGLVERLVLSEIDEDVAAVWVCIFGKDNEQLQRRILHFEIGRENVTEALSLPSRNTVDRAFKTILRNRTFRGGILAEGASLMNVGENGRGVASRWYPDTLVRRMRLLHEFRSQIEFLRCDGLDLVSRWRDTRNATFFVDPPYTVGNGAGKRLYRHNDLDHPQLFSLLANGNADFAMTYDESPGVLDLAGRHALRVDRIPMKNTHNTCKNELWITRGKA